MLLNSSSSDDNHPRMFRVGELRFSSALESKSAFDAYVREADPVRGHALSLEIVVQKDDEIFWLTTDRNFSKRDRLVEAFRQAINAKNSPQFICVDTYGCKLR